jgi:hypothetical protein
MAYFVGRNIRDVIHHIAEPGRARGRDHETGERERMTACVAEPETKAHAKREHEQVGRAKKFCVRCGAHGCYQSKYRILPVSDDLFLA